MPNPISAMGRLLMKARRRSFPVTQRPSSVYPAESIHAGRRRHLRTARIPPAPLYLDEQCRLDRRYPLRRRPRHLRQQFVRQRPQQRPVPLLPGRTAWPRPNR